MASVLLGAAIWLAVLLAAAILIGALLRFSQWAVSETLATTWLAITSIVAFVAFSSRHLAAAMQMATRYVVSALWRTLLRALRVAGLWVLSQFDTKARRQQSASPGFDKAFGNGADDGPYRDAPGGADQADAGAEAEDEAASEQREYERALELLGLQGVERLTRMDLKRRHGELMSILHPDKGFPNQQFAQQVNEAVDIVKRHHAWR